MVDYEVAGSIFVVDEVSQHLQVANWLMLVRVPSAYSLCHFSVPRSFLSSVAHLSAHTSSIYTVSDGKLFVELQV